METKSMKRQTWSIGPRERQMWEYRWSAGKDRRWVIGAMGGGAVSPPGFVEALGFRSLAGGQTAGARPRHVAARSRRRTSNAPVTMESGKNPKAGFRLLESTINFGLLVKTARTLWRSGWLILMNELAPSSNDGSYTRPASAFRTILTTSDVAAPAPGGPAYKVYLGAACPWCHRVALARLLGGAESQVQVVDLVPSDSGLWNLASPEENNGDVTLKDVYKRFSPGYRGRATAPVLIDVDRGSIVNNESADIVRMISETLGDGERILRPADRCDEIDAWNDTIYSGLNNGVYSCGFAKTQDAFDAADQHLIATLDSVEAALEASSDGFLLGNAGLTECDVRLFPTISRFDLVYSPLFRCGGAGEKLVRVDYPNIQAWAERMIQQPGVGATVDVAATRRSYFGSLFPLNPSGIIP